MLHTLSIPSFVFNSYYRRNLEEQSDTTYLEKSNYYSYSLIPITLEIVTLKTLTSALCNRATGTRRCSNVTFWLHFGRDIR